MGDILSGMKPSEFRKKIWDYYREHGRGGMPWRKTHDPYRILVSEVMLQQTQVVRVMEFYPRFLKQFPTARALAKAPLAQVLSAWQGLGYNRRALMLQRAAQMIVHEYKGSIPADYEKLLALPGVGPSTAAGIMNFTYGVATPYLETNVRSVYLHHFFHDASCKQVADDEIMPLLRKTMDQKNPREWYYALLDYGAMLKKTVGNPNKKSKTYARQSPFEGSTRQARARALRRALASGASGDDLLRLVI